MARRRESWPQRGNFSVRRLGAQLNDPSQVLDGAGTPLFVDVDIDYTGFCCAVSGVHRLDHCDVDNIKIDAPPACVSIEQLRKAAELRPHRSAT